MKGEYNMYDTKKWSKKKVEHFYERYGNKNLSNKVKVTRFDRDKFTKIWTKVFGIPDPENEYLALFENIMWESHPPIKCNGFIVYGEEGDINITSIDSGLTVQWYKHLGRSNLATAENLTLSDLQSFFIAFKIALDEATGDKLTSNRKRIPIVPEKVEKLKKAYERLSHKFEINSIYGVGTHDVPSSYPTILLVSPDESKKMMSSLSQSRYKCKCPKTADDEVVIRCSCSGGGGLAEAMKTLCVLKNKKDLYKFLRTHYNTLDIENLKCELLIGVHDTRIEWDKTYILSDSNGVLAYTNKPIDVLKDK